MGAVFIILFLCKKVCVPTLSSLQIPLMVVCLHGTGSEEVDTVKRSIELSRCHDHWLLLHNIHSNTDLLHQLPSLLAEEEGSAAVDMEGEGGEGESAKGGNWRVWLSAHMDTRLPTPILQGACKVVLDSPKVSCLTVATGLIMSA